MPGSAWFSHGHTLKFRVNWANIEQDAAIKKLQNLQRNVWIAGHFSGSPHISLHFVFLHLLMNHHNLQARRTQKVLLMLMIKFYSLSQMISFIVYSPLFEKRFTNGVEQVSE